MDVKKNSGLAGESNLFSSDLFYNRMSKSMRGTVFMLYVHMHLQMFHVLTHIHIHVYTYVYT